MYVGHECPSIGAYRQGRCHLLEEITRTEESWLPHQVVNRHRQPCRITLTHALGGILKRSEHAVVLIPVDRNGCSLCLPLAEIARGPT